jgi:type II secretory pathway component GspD/PulD (secretin)
MAPVRRPAALTASIALIASVALLAGVAWTWAPAAALALQLREPDELVLHAYTLRYQQAIEAIPLIQPLLTGRGTLELQPGGNTLVIRDTAAALARIVPVLRGFDHPAQPLRVEILIVRASRTAAVSPQVSHSDLPESLTRRLRELLPYENYEMQAQAQLASQEGQAVAYELGDDYAVSFRLGTLLEARRIKLANFEVGRRAAKGKSAVPLVHTSLNLCLDQTMSLGLARSEGSRDALIIVVTVRRGDPRLRPERPERPEP